MEVGALGKGRCYLFFSWCDRTSLPRQPIKKHLLLGGGLMVLVLEFMAIMVGYMAAGKTS
jgi:hypothetical protein